MSWHFLYISAFVFHRHGDVSTCLSSANDLFILPQISCASYEFTRWYTESVVSKHYLFNYVLFNNNDDDDDDDDFFFQIKCSCFITNILLTLCRVNFQYRHFEIFFLIFPKKICFGISCKLFPKVFQSLFFFFTESTCDSKAIFWGKL